MKIVTFDDSQKEIPYTDERKNRHRIITISKNCNFSDVKQIEVNDFNNIASNTDDGYIFIPKGNGHNDYSVCMFNNHKEDFEKTIFNLNMPVFGIKTNNKCFLAVVSGMPFTYRLRIELKKGNYSIYPIFYIDGEQPYEDFKLELFELKGDNADYSSMARCYRQYKINSGEIIPLKERIKNNKYLEYAVNSVMIRIRCGWKPAPAKVLHQTLENEPEMHVACDFDRVSDIIDELKTQGVEKAEICLVGWNVKGHDGRWPQAFPVCEELGGEQKLRALIKKGQEMGYQITCHTNHTDQYEIADTYDIENTRRNKDGSLGINACWSGGQMYDLCPMIGYEQAEKILPEVAELGFRGIHYIDVLSITFPRKCYHSVHPVNSGESVQYAKNMCSLAKDLFGGVSSEGAWDFIAPYLDYSLYVSSLTKVKDSLCDKSVPFWQMVYHGTTLSNPYSETINCTFKEKSTALKLAEYGGRPTYYFYSKFMDNNENWMGKTDAVCDTDEQLRSSVEKIKKGYEAYAEAAELHMEFMDKHEEISENVFETTYSNGKVVRVDYNRNVYEII